MKENYLLFFCCFIVPLMGFSQEVLTPLSHNVRDEIIFSVEKKELVGEGYFPISYNKAHYSLPKKDTLHTRSWFARKLLKEHFVQIQNKDFLLTIDPLVNLNIGTEQLQKTPYYLFQNTRGAQAFAQLQDKFSFYTAFYENQARFAPYLNAYFKDRGELYPNSGEGYSLDNAVVPNGGRTKPFKVNGFDYASAVSYVRYTPLENLAFQFGNLPRSYGWGYRTMLMSDNSFNYTHLSLDWEITKGLMYSFSRGKQLNLIRKKYTNFVEKPYERKGIGVHYLSYKITPALMVSLFESTIYLRDEATSDQRVNVNFYKPIIGLSTIGFGGEQKDIKNLLGLNTAWKFHPQHLLYAQVIVDDFKKIEYGAQLGYRIGNPFEVEGLYFQVEYNQASSSLYAAENYRMAYTHFNLPLAHPLGNGFKELVLRGSYKWNGVFLEGKVINYIANQPMKNKTALFQSKLDEVVLDRTQVMNFEVEFGYELNAATRLRLFVNANYRTSSSKIEGDVNYGMISVGIRSALRNQYFDF